MNYATMQDWHDALVKITAEKLPDYNVKLPERSTDRIEIYLPEQSESDWPFMRVELTAAGKIKRDRIRVLQHFQQHRDYETDEQYARNIARVVAEFRAVHDKEVTEQNAHEEWRKAESERAGMLEGLACTEMKKAFVSHNLEYCRATGTHSGGKIEIGFPKIKDETGFAWSRYLALDYKADSEARLSWSIGSGAGAGIPDLAAFAKTIS